jgi:hypothetical protein
MKPYQSHIFTKSEPASISFPFDLSNEDMIFLILVFIYSETKRQDSVRSTFTLWTGRPTDMSLPGAELEELEQWSRRGRGRSLYLDAYLKTYYEVIPPPCLKLSICVIRLWRSEGTCREIDDLKIDDLVHALYTFLPFSVYWYDLSSCQVLTPFPTLSYTPHNVNFHIFR